MDGADETKDTVVRHLFEAIDRARDDLDKVEFWASVVNGFSRPVPDYNSGSMSIWLPREQAKELAGEAARPNRAR